MRISLREIEDVFDDLIQERQAREEIASWASQRQTADDANDLEFEPSKEEARIWKAILYLIGIDLRDIDGGYLHSIENFVEYRKEIGI